MRGGDGGAEARRMSRKRLETSISDTGQDQSRTAEMQAGGEGGWRDEWCWRMK